MANSWNGPQLGSPIRTDVPELQKKLIALLKGDPTSVADIPSGAKRLVNTSGVQWQVQQYNGSSWAAIGKLMHDVDKLDGYHAAITPNANTVAVRNADKKLEGDITGNAATASSAATLSETLPVNKGGTGATTSAAARTNLGVPPTSHASSSTTYGLATDSNYGHVRSDGDTTKIVAGEVVVKDVAIGGDSSDLASGRGQIGDPAAKGTNQNLNNYLASGSYFVNSSGTTPLPEAGKGGVVVVYRQTSSFIKQVFFVHNTNGVYVRHTLNGGDTWTNWVKITVSTDVDDVVRTSGDQTITGIKTFKNNLTVKSDTIDLSNTPTETVWFSPFVFRDKNNTPPFSIQYAQYPTGENVLRFILLGKTGSQEVILTLTARGGESSIKGLTPPDGDSSTKYATTEWVMRNALPAGVLVPSFASSMSGHLLCNGAAVSRVTYKNLFDILGTSFGEGDGETTFNLPDFRGMTFSGAKGNLKSIIPAGLPEISGDLSGVLAWNNFSASGAFSKTFNNYNTSGLGNPEFGSVSFNFKGSRSNGVYGKSTTVQPPAIAVNIFIKY